MRTTFIYALCEPSGEVRYIGKSDDPPRRLKRHFSEKNRETHKNRWLDGLLLGRELPVLEILAEVPFVWWEKFERGFIERFKKAGARLTNTTSGGDGGNTFSGKRHSFQAREKMSVWQRGKKPPLLALVRAREVTLGKPRSEEVRRKISKTKTGVSRPAWVKEKISTTLKNRKLNASL